VKVLDAGDPDAPPTEGRPLPHPDNVSAHFWAEAAAGRLVLQRCTACGETQFYPRAMCVHCGGDTAWEEASGSGRVHTFTVIRQNLARPFASLGPYVVAMVELDEGPRMMSNVTHVAPDDVRVGMPVSCYAVRVADDIGVPFWRPTG